MDFNQQPFMVVWEVTRACALRCRHCRAEAQPRKHPEELTTQEGVALIEQIGRAAPQLLVLTGGDPMMREDLKDLILYAAKKNFRLALSPSATPKLLNTDFHALKKWGIQRMSLSLDGATREEHEAFRGVLQSWDWTMQAIEKAKEAGIGVQINTTIMRQNFKKLEDFRRLMDEIQPLVWTIFLLVPTGRAKNEELLSAEETEGFFNRLYDLSREVSYEIKTTEGQHYRRVFLQRTGIKPENHPVPGVNDGKGFVFVSHTGEICPSGFLPIVAGNVRKDELIEVYRNHETFQQLRDSSLLKGKCGRCEYHHICGGSRARAYAVTGDYLAEEPCCNYQPQRQS